jgi:hypothetical protein
LWNGADAVVRLSKPLALTASSLVKGMQVPGFTLDFQQADFAQVLRCAASYKLTTLSGVSLPDAGSSLGSDELQWAWSQAINQSNYCTSVGMYVVSTELEDITANAGRYYYVINPCVAANHSLSGKEICSYKLVFTSVLTTQEGFSAQLATEAQKLTQLEAQLNASSQNAVLLAQQIEHHLRACEDKWAHDSHMLTFRSGIANLGAMTVGTVIGMNVMGGISGGMMGAMMIGQIGGQFANSKVFQYPPGILNSCIDPSVLPGKGNASAAEGKEIKDKYEKQYGVQSLIVELNALIGPSGTIAKQQAALQSQLAVMQQMNQNVLDLNSVLQKAYQNGIDINDPATYPKKSR